MTDNQNRRFRMFVRVRDFITQRLSDFSETGVALQLYAHLQGVITRLESLSADQAVGLGQAHQRTQTRGSARLSLRDAVEAIHSVAVTMGLGEQFPLPERNDAALLQTARAMAMNALPLKAQFIAHEMPADFIEDLQADITAFESEIAEHGNAVGDHVQAGEAIDEAIDEGSDVVNKLDGIMRAKYASNRAVLAEWVSASHTERAPKRSAAPAPAPVTGGNPASTGGIPPSS
jgi:hypothetical protein